MPADVTIRLLTDTDLPAYKALRDIGLQHDPEAFTSDFDTASALPPATYATRLGQPPDDHFILGAFDSSGAMLGAVVCQRQARLKQRHEAELVGMIIAPAARSKGIGKALLREFDTLVRKLPGLEQACWRTSCSIIRTRSYTFFRNHTETHFLGQGHKYAGPARVSV